MATTNTTPVTPEAKPASRPKTCSAFFAATGIGEAGCKRLPRHNGEHRVTAKRPIVAKVAKSRVTKATAKPLAAKDRKAFLADLASQVEAGTITAGDALSMAAKRIAPAKRRVTRKQA